MTAKISNWGNSQGIRLPKNIIESMHLTIGDKVSVEVENEKIIIEPIKVKKRFDINSLVAAMPDDYIAIEEFNDRIGKEEW